MHNKPSSWPSLRLLVRDDFPMSFSNPINWSIELWRRGEADAASLSSATCCPFWFSSVLQLLASLVNTHSVHSISVQQIAGLRAADSVAATSVTPLLLDEPLKLLRSVIALLLLLLLTPQQPPLALTPPAPPPPSPTLPPLPPTPLPE